MMQNQKDNLLNRHIIWHDHIIKKEDREFLHKHRALLLWFTGLSGSGKSTIASSFEKELHFRSISTYLLDGDNIRHGLCYGLGHGDFDRCENLRRAGEVARLMVDAGLVVLAAFISPYHIERQMIRNMFSVETFFEIFVDTPLSICQQRDPKGLYKMSNSGEIKDLIGLHVTYEKPNKPYICLDGRRLIKDLVSQLLDAFLGKIIHFKI